MDRRAAIGRALRAREQTTPNPAFLSLTDEEQVNGLAMFGAEETPAKVDTAVAPGRTVKHPRLPALPEPGNVLVWQVPVLAAMLVAVVAVWALMSAMASSDRPVERVEVPHDVALPADEPIPRPIPIRMPVVSQAAAIEPPRVRTDPPIRLAAFSNSRPVEPRPAPKPAVAAIVDRPAALPASLAAEPIPAATVPVAVPAAVPAVLPRAEAIPPPARPPAPESAVQTVLARYRDAYDGLDAGAARAVWPSVDHKALSKAFDRLEQQQLLFDACEISVTGARAAASCRGVASYWPRVGNKARRDEQREWEFKLSKVGDAWRIDSVFAR